MASNGHIMDLPKSKLGVDLDNDFEPEYVPIRAKNQALAKIQTAAQTADAHLARARPRPRGRGDRVASGRRAQGRAAPVARLTFNEITQRAVQQALERAARARHEPRERAAGAPRARPAGGLQGEPVRVAHRALRPVRRTRAERGAAADLRARGRDPARSSPRSTGRSRSTTSRPKRRALHGAARARRRPTISSRGQIRGEGAPGARALALTIELGATAARRRRRDRAAARASAARRSSPARSSRRRSTGSASPAKRTMAIAQQLYEGVALGPEGSVGLITYMRTGFAASRRARRSPTIRELAGTDARPGVRARVAAPVQEPQGRAGRARGDPA